jgi:hypothetical protein
MSDATRSPEAADEQALLSALTTEHFTLATARSTAVAESNARSSHYLLSVSSTLVALGFVSQISSGGELFEVFALIVLPTLFVFGLFTFLRLAESSIEDFRYAQATNRIRHFYLEIAGDRGRYFLMTGHDDRAGVWANMSLAPSRWHGFFTMPMAMAFINSVIGASAIALAIGAASAAPLGLSVACGGALAALSLAVHYRYNERTFIRATSEPALFPSPDTDRTR